MGLGYNVNHTVQYMVNTTGDRLFIPANGPAIDKENSGDGMTEEQSMAEQLAFCQNLSPEGVEVVVS